MTRDITIDNRTFIFRGPREWFEVHHFYDGNCIFEVQCGDEYTQSITLYPEEVTKLRVWLASEGY